MLKVQVMHRDLKPENIMLHFPDYHTQLITMKSKDKKNFINMLNLSETLFEVKIIDFGFSRKLESLEEKMNVICGTPVY